MKEEDSQELQMHKNKFDILKLLGAVIMCQLAGFIGSVFTFNSVNTWYLTLNKPFFNPPSWIFGPVWVSLYFLMGISLYLVWNKGFKSKVSKSALSFFITQLVLNSLWSIIFFGLKSSASVISRIFVQ